MRNRFSVIDKFLKKPKLYRPKKAVGLDIGGKFIKIVEIVKTPKGYALRRYGIKELPPEVIVDGDVMDRETLVEEIRSLVEDCGIKEKNVALTISGRNAIIKSVSVKQPSKREFSGLISELAKKNIPHDLSDISLDYKISKAEKNELNVLLVAAKNEELYTLIDIVKDAGLSPAIIDTIPFVLQHIFQTTGLIPKDGVCGIINIGFERTSVVIIKDGAYHSDKDIAVGLRTFIEAIRRRLSLSFDEAMAALQGKIAKDLNKQDIVDVIKVTAQTLLRQIERIAPPVLKECKKLIVSGEGVEIIGIMEIFTERFKTICEIADPLRGIHHEGDEVPGYKLAIAVGLALSKLSKEKVGVNLLPPDERVIEPPKGIEVIKTTFPIYTVGITLAVLLGIFFSLEYKEYKLKEDVKTMEVTQQILKKRVAMVEDIMKKERDIKLKLDIIEELSKDKYLRIGLLDELNKLITPNTWLTYLKEEATDTVGLHLMLKGVTTSNLSVSRFMKRMQESPYFRDVKLSYTQMKKIDGIETTEFEIKGIFQNRRKRD